MKLILMQILCYVVLVHCNVYPVPEVKTTLGKIHGYLKTSHKGKKFAAFEGIPYAKPPVGQLRFEESIPAEPWHGIWNATVLHECFQVGFLNHISGQEDCLYVNVYVPRRKIDPRDNLDVIVHTHGGAFMYGSPHSYTLPDFLVDVDLIFVSLNYRLGVLGFLSTGDDVIPGNNGLKDQVLALKWIKENIEYFGGNPNSITLTGFSAGGASSHYHYLSPKSRGLFHRGISHSGSSLQPWALSKHPLKQAQKLARLVGCPEEPSSELKACLKQRSAKGIGSKLKEFWYLGSPITPFGPVVEKGDNSFLPKHPYQILHNKEVNDIPWIFSSTSEDGLYPGYLYEDLIPEVEDNWIKYAPYLLEFHETKEEELWAETSEKIKDFYFGNGNEIDDYNTFIKKLTDRIFTVGMETSAKLQARASSAPVYYYLYAFKGNYTFTDNFSPDMKMKGVSHGDDIIHLYGNVVENAYPSEQDEEMTKLFLNMMQTFAHTNVPQLGGIKWEPTKANELTYLKISSPSDIKLETTNQLSAIDFWKSLELDEFYEVMVDA